MQIFTENRKANFDYEILEKLDAGLALLGQEVKSIRLGRAGLSGSYIMPRQNELFLVGCQIPAYQPKNALNYIPSRERKLLLTRKEISYVLGRISQKGLTLIPLKLYTNGSKIKLELALAKHKKKSDKRETIKRREASREIKEALG